MEDIAIAFPDVDKTSNPQFFVDYMIAANTAPSLVSRKRIIVESMAIKEGDAVLDVGCGPGQDVRALGQIVGPRGRSVGVDSSEAMLASARSHADNRGLSTEYIRGSVEELPFPDGTFDACRAECLFMHVPDPPRGLREMIRVARRGARVAIHDFDWQGHNVIGPDPKVTEAIVRYMARGFLHGSSGSELPAMFHDAGLKNITVAPHTTLVPTTFYPLVVRGTIDRAREEGLVTAEQVDRWFSDMEASAKKGHFFAWIQGFVVSGEKA